MADIFRSARWLGSGERIREQPQAWRGHLPWRAARIGARMARRHRAPSLARLPARVEHGRARRVRPRNPGREVTVELTVVVMGYRERRPRSSSRPARSSSRPPVSPSRSSWSPREATPRLTGCGRRSPRSRSSTVPTGCCQAPPATPVVGGGVGSGGHLPRGGLHRRTRLGRGPDRRASRGARRGGHSGRSARDAHPGARSPVTSCCSPPGCRDGRRGRYRRRSPTASRSGAGCWTRSVRTTSTCASARTRRWPRRIAARGVPLWFEPRAVTQHPAPTTLGGLLRDQYVRGARRRAHGPPTREVVRPSIRQLRDRLGVVVLDGWPHRAWPRRRLVAAAPAALVGALANQAGWIRGQSPSSARVRSSRISARSSVPPSLSDGPCSRIEPSSQNGS